MARLLRRHPRRSTLAVAATVLGVVLISLPGGSSRHSRTYQLGGAAQPTVLAPPALVVHGVRRGASPPPAERFVPAPAAVKLSGSLSLAQQVAQLFVLGLPGGSTGGVTTLGGLDWGGVVLGRLSFRGDAQAATLAGAIAAKLRGAGGVAPLVALEPAGAGASGLTDVLPTPEPVLGATGQPGLARTQALQAGRRLRALRFNMALAPLADVDTTGGALSGRLYSSDPATVASFSQAALSGYAAARVISAAGHFPGTGGASADPDQMTATVGGSLAALRARDLIPFAALAPQAPVIVMSNAVYAAFDGVTPAGLLRQAVDLLRDGYGFQGVVMSDDLDAALQATGTDAGTAALAALRAGDDLLYISGSPTEQRTAYAAVLAAARGNASLGRQVRYALLRVLTLKASYGLLSRR